MSYSFEDDDFLNDESIDGSISPLSVSGKHTMANFAQGQQQSRTTMTRIPSQVMPQRRPSIMAPLPPPNLDLACRNDLRNTNLPNPLISSDSQQYLPNPTEHLMQPPIHMPYMVPGYNPPQQNLVYMMQPQSSANFNSVRRRSRGYESSYFNEAPQQLPRVSRRNTPASSMLMEQLEELEKYERNRQSSNKLSKDDEALILATLVSEQDIKYGTNMLENITSTDRIYIQDLMQRYGCPEYEALRLAFERKPHNLSRPKKRVENSVADSLALEQAIQLSLTESSIRACQADRSTTTTATSSSSSSSRPSSNRCASTTYSQEQADDDALREAIRRSLLIDETKNFDNKEKKLRILTTNSRDDYDNSIATDSSNTTTSGRLSNNSNNCHPIHNNNTLYSRHSNRSYDSNEHPNEQQQQQQASLQQLQYPYNLLAKSSSSSKNTDDKSLRTNNSFISTTSTTTAIQQYPYNLQTRALAQTQPQISIGSVQASPQRQNSNSSNNIYNNNDFQTNSGYHNLQSNIDYQPEQQLPQQYEFLKSLHHSNGRLVNSHEQQQPYFEENRLHEIPVAFVAKNNNISQMLQHSNCSKSDFTNSNPPTLQQYPLSTTTQLHPSNQQQYLHHQSDELLNQQRGMLSSIDSYDNNIRAVGYRSPSNSVEVVAGNGKMDRVDIDYDINNGFNRSQTTITNGENSNISHIQHYDSNNCILRNQVSNHSTNSDNNMNNSISTAATKGMLLWQKAVRPPDNPNNSTVANC